MRAEIITIGDELLIGQVVDTNSAFMAEELNKIGIELYQITSVHDDAEHIRNAVTTALQRVDVVITTGGLGPTKDDITKNVLCELFGGKLVPDDVTIGIVRDRLAKKDCDKGFILDGFPRTVEQADALKDILEGLKRPLTKVLNIHVPSEDLVERAVGRRICKSCGATYHVKFNAPKVENVCDECNGQLYQRADDNEETMKNRLAVYEDSTRPLIEYYKKAGVYTEIDGRQPIEKVTEELVNVLSSVKD